MKTKTNKAGVLTNEDLDKIAELLDRQFAQRLAPLATNERVDELETNLKTHINEGIETVMTGMDNLLAIKTRKRS